VESVRHKDNDTNGIRKPPRFSGHASLNDEGSQSHNDGAQSVHKQEVQEVQEVQKKDSFVGSAPTPYLSILRFWNEKFRESPIPTIRPPLSKTRKRKLRARWHEWGQNGSDPWQTFEALCEYMAHDPFHLGKNDRGWKANIDYLIRNDGKWGELLERAEAERKQAAKGEDRQAEIQREVEEFFCGEKEARGEDET